MSIPDPIRSALEGAGISTSSLDRIRLARGVVGKVSYVAAAALLVLAAVAFALRQPDYLMWIGAFAVCIFVIYFLGILWFANRYPGLALLEGAELIQWRQMEMAAKDFPLPPKQPLEEISGSEP